MVVPFWEGQAFILIGGLAFKGVNPTVGPLYGAFLYAGMSTLLQKCSPYWSPPEIGKASQGSYLMV